MLSCKSCCIAVLLAILLLNSSKFKASCDTSSMWGQVGKATGILLHNCLPMSAAGPPEQFLIVLQDCLRRRSLLAFERMLDRDIIELIDGVTLVRFQKENETRNNRALSISKSASRFDENEGSWRSRIAEKLKQLFRTHVLKVHLNGFNGLQFEARRRHKHNNMMSHLFMFALIAAGVIVIPMGFQFLAILGGKALLLAKMALLMTSIQGLKKIATSNLNYGLYSYGQGPWHYDRKYEHEGYGGDNYPYGYENSHHYDILHPREDLV